METNFDFKIQVKEPDQKEAVWLCQQNEAQNGWELFNVSEDSKYFESGADLISVDGISIDVKCDKRISETGNVAFELIEICSLNKFIKLGWAYSSVDFIYYVDWNNKINYKFKLSQLRQEAFSKARTGFSAYHPNEKYFTLGILLPIKELTSIKCNL